MGTMCHSWVSCGTNRKGTHHRHPERGMVQAGCRQGAGGLGAPRGPSLGFWWPKTRWGEGQTRGGCGSVREPSWALFLPDPERRDWKGNGKLLLDERLARRR